MTPGGSRWYRVDFHLHTPAVDSFAGLDGVNFSNAADQRRLAIDYAARLKEAGIEIAAITDYNGIREPWFSMIREEAALLGVLVLPGVELSVSEGKNGVHILVVFGPDTAPDTVNEYLRALDRSPAEKLFDRRVHRDINLRDHLVDVLKALRDRFDCLLIPAHADSSKGIVSSLGAQLAASVIAEADLDGLDHSGNALSKIRSSRVSWRWEHLALVEFSDPRSLADIGSRTMPDGSPRGTWLKLSSLEIDAMRLALHDPQTRVTTTPPPAPSNGRIISVTAQGTGFLADTTLSFDANLNTLIGGRGTGKSAVLETIRYALSIPAFCDGDKRQELVRHALGSGGKVELEIERQSDNGLTKRYRVSRVFGDEPQVTDCQTGEVLALEPKETFGPDHEPIILLQREIDKVSGDPGYRRLLLDRLIGDEVHQAEIGIDKACAALRENGLDIRKHAGEQASRPELGQQIGKLEHEQTIYEVNGVMDKLSKHTRLQQQRDYLTAARDLADAALADDAPWRQAFAQTTAEVDEMHTTLTGHGENLATAASNALSAVAEVMAAAQSQVTAALQVAAAELRGLIGQHDADVLQLSDELNKIKQDLNAERLDADHALSLSRRLTPLRAKLEALNRKAPILESLRTTRRGLLDALVKERGRASDIRLAAARDINTRLSSRVEVLVTPHGDTAQFANDLKLLLQSSGTQSTAIDAIAQAAIDGASIADAVRKGASEVTDRFGVSAAQAAKMCNWLDDEATGRLSDLELLAPRDRVDIVLQVDDEKRPLDRASAGQRATAILMLIFAVDDRCMILDQPEDDLDNRFIFDDVVQMIRSQKATLPGSTRQIIAATHNPNIPVLGDAELVIVLDANGTQMLTAARGSIDAPDIRIHVRQVLEGGEEAFTRRYQKYGGPRLGPTPKPYNPLADTGHPLISRQPIGATVPIP